MRLLININNTSEIRKSWSGKSLTVVFVLLVLFCGSCAEEAAPVPKPRAYPRVIYPERSYEAFDLPGCPFTFQMPAYAQIEQDTQFFGEKPQHPCWFNVVAPQFGSTIHFSYYPVEGAKSLEQLKRDAFDLAGKHNIKANYIDELPIQRPDGTQGFAFNIEGAVASPFQFYLTDGQAHFVRGALYFNTQARPDSLAPVYDFVKTDIMEIINTLEWK